MKIRVTVDIRHTFDFETSSEDRKEIQKEVENKWDMILNNGTDHVFYEETIIDWQEV